MLHDGAMLVGIRVGKIREWGEKDMRVRERSAGEEVFGVMGREWR